MQKLISDHSINHTIAGKVNSRSIKQFHTYTGNFSFKISFSFLNQSLQGNLHKLLKQQLHGYQNHLKLSCTACRESTACTKRKTAAVRPVHVRILMYRPVHTIVQICTVQICTNLCTLPFQPTENCKSILFLLCIVFSPLVTQPAQLFNCNNTSLSCLIYAFLKP
jgi:hypothetical protein